MTVVVFGSINLDLVIPVAHLPLPGETVVGAHYRLIPGGKGANQALAAARDGARVTMVGAVGVDEFATLALAELVAAGVDVQAVARSTTMPTGCAAITVDARGENQITVASGANQELHARQVPDAALGPGTVLLLQREVSALATVEVIDRAGGARVWLNLAPALPLERRSLAKLEALIVNEREAVSLSEHLGIAQPAGAALASALGVITVETLGAAGARLIHPDGRGWQCAALAITPVDTVGAGDCFVGVLAASAARGADWPEALHRATVAASLACLEPGAQTSMPTAAKIDAHLNQLAPARPWP